LELGTLTGVPTPTIQAVHALAGLLARSLSAHAGGLRLA
jgi:hypothetical protein